MLDANTLARATGQVEAIADARTPNVDCTVREEKDAWVVVIPKRVPFSHLTPTAPKENSKGQTIPGAYVYAKLNVPRIVITAFGVDGEGKDTEITLPSKPSNNFNLFLKI